MARPARLIPDLTPGTRLALHACCAPCAGGIISSLNDAAIALTVIWANPNIDEDQEHQRRRDCLQDFCAGLGIPFIDLGYDHPAWLAAIRGLEAEPERGRRCERCFVLRLQAAAAWAHTHHHPQLATTLGIGRHKDLEQVNRAGQAAVATCPDVSFVTHNWRRGGGIERMQSVASQAGFYRQDYCGCPFARR